MKNIIIDPVSIHYLNNQLFNKHNTVLNRDNTLEPGIRLRDAIIAQGAEMHTVDVAIERGITGQYWNMGNLNSPYLVQKYQDQFDFTGLMLFEPPVVKPRLYAKLNSLADKFKHIHVHSLDIVAPYLSTKHHHKIREFRWPMAPFEINQPFFNATKQHLICCIIGIHHPRDNNKELYSFRTNWIAELSQQDTFDLFGAGWTWPGVRTFFWTTYTFNRHSLLRRYCGRVESKIATMSNYKFALCIENMRCNGYITEKIFDCFFAGCIPIYYGAPNIASFVPNECYIPLENFKSARELTRYLENLSNTDIEHYRSNILKFLTGQKFEMFKNGLLNAICQS